MNLDGIKYVFNIRRARGALTIPPRALAAYPLHHALGEQPLAFPEKF
jgi:hypothetical protein